MVCNGYVLYYCMFRGWPTFLRNRSREHATFSKSFATGTSRLEGAGLGSWIAGQERQTGLVTTAPRFHDAGTDTGQHAGAQGLDEKAADEHAVVFFFSLTFFIF